MFLKHRWKSDVFYALPNNCVGIETGGSLFGYFFKMATLPINNPPPPKRTNPLPPCGYACACACTSIRVRVGAKARAR